MGDRPNSNITSELDLRLAKPVFALRLAKPMFALSLTFLALIAALIVLWVDIPRVEILAAEASEVASSMDLADTAEDEGGSLSSVAQGAFKLGDYCAMLLMAIWPLFWIEFIYKIYSHEKSKGKFLPKRIFDLLICFCPPLRLAAPNYQLDGEIWLPKLGWQQPGKQLSRILERTFGVPMLIIAMFILPVLLIEFGLKEAVESRFWLRLALHISTGLIWCAFAVEFLVMVCATDRKLRYIKKNWLDLAIILLPLISFLRSLRAVRAFRVAKLAKVQQLAKLGRVYRLRGLVTKALKALLLLEFLNRVMRVTPEKKLAKLKATRIDRAEELAELDSDIRQLERKITAKNEELARADQGTIENLSGQILTVATAAPASSTNKNSDSESSASTNTVPKPKSHSTRGAKHTTT